MKRVLINCLGVFFSLTVLSFGCEDVSDGLSIELNEELTKTIHVDLGSNQEVSITQILDAADEQEIADNIDNIESYEVEELTIDIENVVGDNNVELSGHLGAGGLNSQNEEWVIVEKQVPLIVAGEAIEWFVADGVQDQALINSLKAAFEADNGIKFYMTGSASAPVSFDVIVTAKIKVKVGA